MAELDNSPVEVEVDSPSAQLDNTTNDVNPEQGIMDYAMEHLTQNGIDLGEVVDEESKAQVSEVTQEEETSPVEDAEDTNIEADTESNEEEEVTPETVEESSDKELVDTDSLDEFLFPTPEGNKTWAQIQSELGQVKAASRSLERRQLN